MENIGKVKQKILLGIIALGLGGVIFYLALLPAAVNREVTSLTAAEITAGAALDLKPVHSQSLILLDRQTGQVLRAREENRIIFPASLTKLMTAAVVLDQLPDLNETLTVPAEIFPYLEQQHASVAGFKPGEKVRVLDLLYGVLLPSGADGSLTLAKKIAGSEAGFARLMNAKALELGMTRTHFMNPTGLQDIWQYSTARDMAILLRYDLTKPRLRQILTTPVYYTQPTQLHPQGIRLRNHVFGLLGQQERLRLQGEPLVPLNAAGWSVNLKPAEKGKGKPDNTKTINASTNSLSWGEGETLADGALSPMARILGGKTGATSSAGLCMASLAKVHGREYLLVTTAAAANIYVDHFHIKDALFIYGQLDQLWSRDGKN
jgi:D-alanyl-D-alanine carboxypeptidase (penicillin-binding protein 5/6)